LDNDIHTLTFIGRGRVPGYTVNQIAELVCLGWGRSRASADVKRVALE